MVTVLIIILIILVIGGIPNMGFHQHGWGPSGLGFILVIVLLCVLAWKS